MMKKYLIILLLIVGYVSINAQDQGVLSLSQLSSANATDAYYVSTTDSGDFHVRWSTLYNDVYNYYPDRLTGLDTVDNNYYLIVNKDSVAYKIKWSVFLDSLNVDVYDSVRGIVNDTANVLRIEWRVDINDSLGRFWDSVVVEGYVNDTLNYYIDSVSIIDTINSIINDSLDRFWDSVEVKNYVNDTINYYIDSTATIDTINSLINDSLSTYYDSTEVRNHVNDTLNYYIDSASIIDTINSIVNSKIYLNKPFSTYTSNSVTISCDSSGYSEIDISGDLTINFNPLPSAGEMSSWTIMINGDATARDLTIQESGTAIDSLYWSNANELDSIPANDTIVVGANINNSGVWFMNYLKRGN
jgi:hypothetical protein